MKERCDGIEIDGRSDVTMTHAWTGYNSCPASSPTILTNLFINVFRSDVDVSRNSVKFDSWLGNFLVFFNYCTHDFYSRYQTDFSTNYIISLMQFLRSFKFNILGGIAVKTQQIVHSNIVRGIDLDISLTAWVSHCGCCRWHSACVPSHPSSRGARPSTWRSQWCRPPHTGGQAVRRD